jgi:TRAP-type C4-dicarboxylate transport system substrate-binding protein
MAELDIRLGGYVSLTAHLFGVALLLVNRKRFDLWPTDVQSAVRSAASTVTATQRREAAAEDEAWPRRLLAKGVQFVSPDEKERRAFQRVALAPY